ncbi:hypothetical protein DMUE_0661 [Dictyocoela muelleri]|nr:hypothetical protein DMUE_0661 [Dictyocoela muelleri]
MNEISKTFEEMSKISENLTEFENFLKTDEMSKTDERLKINDSPRIHEEEIDYQNLKPSEKEIIQQIEFFRTSFIPENIQFISKYAQNLFMSGELNDIRSKYMKLIDICVLSSQNTLKIGNFHIFQPERNNSEILKIFKIEVFGKIFVHESFSNFIDFLNKKYPLDQISEVQLFDESLNNDRILIDLPNIEKIVIKYHHPDNNDKVMDLIKKLTYRIKSLSILTLFFTVEETLILFSSENSEDKRSNLKYLCLNIGHMSDNRGLVEIINVFDQLEELSIDYFSDEKLVAHLGIIQNSKSIKNLQIRLEGETHEIILSQFEFPENISILDVVFGNDHELQQLNKYYDEDLFLKNSDDISSLKLIDFEITMKKAGKICRLSNLESLKFENCKFIQEENNISASMSKKFNFDEISEKIKNVDPENNSFITICRKSDFFYTLKELALINNQINPIHLIEIGQFVSLEDFSYHGSLNTSVIFAITEKYRKFNLRKLCLQNMLCSLSEIIPFILKMNDLEELIIESLKVEVDDMKILTNSNYFQKLAFLHLEPSNKVQIDIIDFISNSKKNKIQYSLANLSEDTYSETVEKMRIHKLPKSLIIENGDGFTVLGL